MEDINAEDSARNTYRIAEDVISKKHSSTSFNTHVADVTDSILVLPSTFPLNSERYKLIQEGTVSDTEFNDAPGQFELSVNGDATDAHELQARQRLTYVPNYELLWGAAFHMQNQLEPGQLLTIKLADPTNTNGYITEITSDSRESYILNGGSKIDVTPWGSDSEQTGSEDPYVDGMDETRPQVLRSYLSWYGDGRDKVTLAYADEYANMHNPTVAKTANLGDVATEEINLNISVRLECTEATTANTVNVLSFGALNRGDGSPTNRTKSAVNWNLGGSINSTSYTPLLAVRRIPSKSQIPTELNDIEIIPTDTMEVIAVAFDDSQTDASDWDVPRQQDLENTAVEQTTNITTFPTDVNGNPDGRFIDIIVGDASGNKGTRAEADVRDEFYEDEILVFLARTKSASNSSVDLLYDTRQEW